MLNLLATRAPGSYADSNLAVDSATDSAPFLEGVETGSHRRPSHLARGHTTLSRLAARTVTVAGTAAALSPVAMAADPATSSFDMGHVIAFAAGAAALKGFQMIGARFAAAVLNDFEARKQAALSRALPSLEGAVIPKGAELVALPAGEFMMGMEVGDISHSDGEESIYLVSPGGQKPAHLVVLSAFYMTTKDVSNALFKEFRPTHESGKNLNGPNQPVVGVDHSDTMDFADWMNETHSVPGMEWRLPTEAEMEYATLGKSQRANHHRKISGHGKTLDVDAAGYDNTYGLFHIHGNALKWCLDDCRVYTEKPVINPRGPITGRTFSLRGSSFKSHNWRLRLRSWRYAWNNGDDISFRLVLVPKAV